MRISLIVVLGLFLAVFLPSPAFSADANELYARGVSEYNGHDYMTAFRTFSEAIKIDGTDPDYYDMAAKCLNKLGFVQKGYQYAKYAEKLRMSAQYRIPENKDPVSSARHAAMTEADAAADAAGDAAAKAALGYTPEKTRTLMKISFLAGYTGTDMTEINEDTDTRAVLMEKSMDSQGYKGASYVEHVLGGLYLSADLAFRVADGVHMGFRASVIKPNDLVLGYNGRLDTGYAAYDAHSESVLSTVLVPVLAGIGFDFDLSDRFNAGTWLYAGVGFAGVSQNIKMTITDGQNTVSGSEVKSASGAGLAVDLGGSLGVKLGRNTVLSLIMGYRMADVGGVVKDVNGHGQALNFGGLTIGSGVLFYL